MEPTTYQAMIVEKTDDEQITRRIGERHVDELPDGDVLIRVHYSSLNYKDGLAASGNPSVVRVFPHTPGIDAAGVVIASRADAFPPGAEVLVQSFGLGTEVPGGFGQYVRVPAAWVIPRPANLSTRECMCMGIAGYTAGQMTLALETHGVTPDKGEVLVTGATGGVGCMAVATLSKAGYQVVAATGKTDEQQFLRDLGAATVVHRGELDDESGRPMLKGRWAGVVDTVGGNILATAIKTTKYDGVVTCCGMVAATDFASSVFPFILRGVSLVGIDASSVGMATRLKVWQRLATVWRLEQLETMATERGLDELSDEIDLIMAGQQRGRVLVNLG